MPLMSEKMRLPDPRIIPANTPAEAARWVVNNKDEAKRRVGKLRREVDEAIGRSSSSTSSISPEAWERIFGNEDNSESEE